jgi:hypothetical protein
MSRSRVVTFIVVCGLAVALAVGTVIRGTQQAKSQRRPTAASAQDQVLQFGTVRSAPHVVFRSTAFGPTYGRLAVVPLDRPDGPRAVGPVSCERVYATRKRGLCLTTSGGVVPTYHAVTLNAALSPLTKVTLSGGPSRARLSPDSNLVAVTVFVAGHSYLQSGFSTLTTVRTALTGRLLANLEDFRVIRDGKPYRSVDLNVWGVTFVDSDRFFATAASRGKTWLVEGSLAARELRTIRENAECPSVSPDGTRIAYKHRIGLVRWRLHVLDLTSGRDVELAESRSVDDQVEWLDGDRILYGLPREGTAETDVWVVPADGTGSPAVYIPYAWSPSVVR